jgi:hypothetical protein
LKKYLLALLLLIAFNNTNAQTNKSENTFEGIGGFLLGTPKSVFRDSLSSAQNGKFDYDGKSFHSYSYGSVWKNPYLFLEIKFKAIALTFENDKILDNVQFVAFYLNNDTINTTKRIKKEFIRVKKYFENIYKAKGKIEVILDEEKSTYKKYIWEDVNITTEVALSEHKYAKNKNNCSISIQYFLKKKKLDQE